MNTLVVRITPRRIERLVFMLIITLFIFTTISYANKYYDTTEEDIGYFDKIFSGTFFEHVPTEAEIVKAIEEDPSEVLEPEVNESEDLSVNVTETIVEDIVEESEPEPVVEEVVACTAANNKVVAWNTNDDVTGSKVGEIETLRLQFCNEGDENHYMMAEVAIWDKLAIDEGFATSRQNNPERIYQMISMTAGEKYSPLPYELTKSTSVYGDEKFYYKIKFYYVDSEKEKIDGNVIYEISSSYTIK